jgi:hypothetical protein
MDRVELVGANRTQRVHRSVAEKRFRVEFAMTSFGLISSRALLPAWYLLSWRFPLGTIAIDGTGIAVLSTQFAGLSYGVLVLIRWIRKRFKPPPENDAGVAHDTDVR